MSDGPRKIENLKIDTLSVDPEGDGLTVYFNPFDGATIEENNARIARGWIPMFFGRQA